MENCITLITTIPFNSVGEPKNSFLVSDFDAKESNEQMKFNTGSEK